MSWWTFCPRSFSVRPCFLLSLFASLLAFSWITAAHGKASYVEDVRRVCGYARYPQHCVDTLLSRREPSFRQDFAGVASVLVETIRDEVTPGVSMSSSLEAVEILGAREAIDYCNELMEISIRRLNQSLNALEVAPVKDKQNIQTWLSAVITFQESCKDSVSELPRALSKEVSTKMDHLAVLSSNALALANRIPEDGKTGKDRKLLGSADIKATAVVAADGSGDYTSIRAALASASSGGGQTVIFIKEGVYKEKLTYKTIITYDSSVVGGATTTSSATVVVTGDRFIAKDIGFENSAGPTRGQAVALRILSDRAVLYRCSIRGYQDTLLAQAFRQFYRDCDIYGTVDFIFGNAAAIFQSCNLVLCRPRSGGRNVIMASGRTDPGQSTGFVAQKCTIQASSDLSPVRHSVRSYLGRPWKEYARAVIIQSSIDDSIHPRGWMEKAGGFALCTLYFAEGLNNGPGARTTSRVDWPGFHLIGSSESSKFTVSNFIQGTSWIPSTGVTYQPGL
ncbi:unnamed protein product [Spirodela intermedia]|uniref:Pectinesterase n=1 Tax=Spirodela intermedia TaxID=51605 RepID=A0A7I8J2W5_SPIIN|nr:unnamed protein product [Spirodela intermedia]CAA6664577.1 unnamed protein product [Spirodela intermedia]